MSGELYDTENNPVVVILELDVKGKGGIKLDEIKVVSAYGKESMQNLIDNSRVQYISKDKEKTSRWIKRTRLQLPFGLTTTSYIDSIAQNQKNTIHFSYPEWKRNDKMYSRMPRHSCCEIRVMQSMTYFFCAS